MGVGSSVELRDLTAIAAETMDVFAEFYSKEYALQLVRRLEKGDLDTIKYSMVYPPQELASGSRMSPNFRWSRRLFWPPILSPKESNRLNRPSSVPTRPWQEGFLLKRGKYNTQWKKRWFILHNRARNYELEYLTATREAKGSIAMVGMTVTTAPDHTLVLEPSDRSRIYYLKASDRGEQKRWKYILQFAARKAVPDLNANAMLHLTFEGAFAHTRQHFGMYDLYYSAGNEVTQLISLILQRSEDVWKPYVAGLSTSEDSEEVKAKTRAHFMDSLFEHVHGIVSKGWRECEAGLAKYRDVLEEFAMAPGSTARIQADAAQLQAHCSKLIAPLIPEAIVESVSVKVEAFLNVAARVAFKAGKSVIRTFRSRCLDLFEKSRSLSGSVTPSDSASGEGTPAELRLDSQLNQFMQALRFPLDGLYDADSWIMWFTRPKSSSAPDKTRLKLPVDIADVKAMLAPLKLRDFENAMLFRTHKCMARAIYTLSPLVTHVSSKEQARIQLNDVSILLAHDLIHGLTKEFSILLRVAVGADIMTKHYAAAVATASGTVCAGLIEDYITLGFVSVPDCVQKAIAAYIHTGLDVALSAKLMPLLQKLTVIAAEVPTELPPE